ncbi:MAG: hypothetical protein COA32_17565 [Fluviicola sp.]|nr:MAG: hypothetical protein COA32_17565 [Fluviicola sp.]
MLQNIKLWKINKGLFVFYLFICSCDNSKLESCIGLTDHEIYLNDSLHNPIGLAFDEMVEGFVSKTKIDTNTFCRITYYTANGKREGKVIGAELSISLPDNVTAEEIERIKNELYKLICVSSISKEEIKKGILADYYHVKW